MNKRKTGKEYEDRAADYLKNNGVRILEHNYQCRMGEIDLIGRDNEYLVFIEVKYRKDNEKGLPEEAVNYTKRKNICKVADFYRMTRGIGEFEAVRYDVVSCCGEDITWYQNAFEHIYR